jgi:hypothetical protein
VGRSEAVKGGASHGGAARGAGKLKMPHGAPHMTVSTLLRVTRSDGPTAAQVRDQLEAFDVAVYEVGVIPPRHRTDLKPERTRKFTTAQLSDLKTIAWLKRMNASDRNIFCRPAALADGRLTPLIFVDDLSAEQVGQMEAAGLPLAIAVESSPSKFHGWVRIAAEPISRAEAQSAARGLARRFGGDLAAAAWNQYGRLAGFTNRKREHLTASGAPFARLRKASKDVAPAGPGLLAEIRTELVRRSDSPGGEKSSVPDPDNRNLPRGLARHGSAVEVFRAARDQVRAVRLDGSHDQSRKDFGAACKLIELGYELAEIAVAMMQESPGILERHRYPDDYVRRTLGAAWRRASR